MMDINHHKTIVLVEQSEKKKPGSITHFGFDILTVHRILPQQVKMSSLLQPRLLLQKATASYPSSYCRRQVTTSTTRFLSSSINAIGSTKATRVSAIGGGGRRGWEIASKNGHHHNRRSFGTSLADQVKIENKKYQEEQQRESSSNSPAAAMHKVRKQLWEFYFSTGRGANALFEALDLEEKGEVDPVDLQNFMKEVLTIEDEPEVDPVDIMPYAWNRLEQKKESGQKYDIRDFKKWLVAATKMSADTKNSRLLEYLNQDPSLGDVYLSDIDEGEHPEDIVYTWNEETMSQSLRKMQYAVRGEVVMKADQLASQGKKILYTNIGNPHQVGQLPITYYRQVIALCDLPAEVGVDHPNVYDMFPKDVVERAKEYREIIGPSGTGAYTHSQGILGLREHVAQYIQNRDGYKAYPGNIFLTNGTYLPPFFVLLCRIKAPFLWSIDFHFGLVANYSRWFFLTKILSFNFRCIECYRHGITRSVSIESRCCHDPHPTISNLFRYVDIPLCSITLRFRSKSRASHSFVLSLISPFLSIYTILFYLALIAKLGGRQVGYELDENLNWAVSREELDKKLAKAKKEGLDVKALAMINPGNPSGNVMTHCDIQVITEFCEEHGIVLLADEVYQRYVLYISTCLSKGDYMTHKNYTTFCTCAVSYHFVMALPCFLFQISNVYAEGAEFVSAKKVAMDCRLKNLQIVSFHSTSKGLIGECGRRGGYMELHRIDPYVQSQLYKLASSDLVRM